MAGPVASMIVGEKQKHQVEKWREMVGLVLVPEHSGTLGAKHKGEACDEMLGPVHPGTIIGTKHQGEGSIGKTGTVIEMAVTGTLKGMIGEKTHPLAR